MMILRFLIYAAIAASAGAQTLEFDAVSVKPAAPESHTETRRYPGGRFTATAVTLKALVQRAWNVKDFQIVGATGWMSSEQTWSRGQGSLVGTKVPMEMFAEDLLESQLSRVVKDNTGIKGEYDIRLTWTPDTVEETGPSLFTSIQEQMGLRLESTKGPVEMLVLDKAERPSGN